MAKKKAEMPKAGITQEMLDNMRSKLGLKLRTDDSIHNEDATRCHAIFPFAASG